MKNLIWMALAATVSAVSAALAVRALAVAWRDVTGEDPPVLPKWARLASSPLRSQVEKRVAPGL